MGFTPENYKPVLPDDPNFTPRKGMVALDLTFAESSKMGFPHLSGSIGKSGGIINLTAFKRHPDYPKKRDSYFVQGPPEAINALKEDLKASGYQEGT